MLRPQVTLMLSVQKSLESHCGDCLLTQLGVLKIAKPGLLLGEVGTPRGSYLRLTFLHFIPLGIVRDWQHSICLLFPRG